MNGRWLATACKARNAQTAAVLLWDTTTFACVGALQGHESTVSCVEFSPCGTWLASSGKDRSMCLYARIDSESAGTDGYNESNANKKCPFQLVEVQKGVHKRIVWDLAWSPAEKNGVIVSAGLSDDRQSLLASASRDGTCKLWKVTPLSAFEAEEGNRRPYLSCILTFTPFSGTAVTALHFSFAPSEKVALAVGSGEGGIKVFSVWTEETDREKKVSEVGSIADSHAHGATVKRLRWSPTSMRLASCGEDNTVRLFSVKL